MLQRTIYLCIVLFNPMSVFSAEVCQYIVTVRFVHHTALLEHQHITACHPPNVNLMHLTSSMLFRQIRWMWLSCSSFAWGQHIKRIKHKNRNFRMWRACQNLRFILYITVAQLSGVYKRRTECQGSQLYMQISMEILLITQIMTI